MLDEIFFQILNMSLTSAFVILFVLLARLLLKKAPKVFSYALWAVVLFRLVCPFSFESVISLLPEKSEPITPEVLYSQELPEIPVPEFQGGFDIPHEDFIYEEEPFVPVVSDVPEISDVPEAPAEPEVSTMQVLTFAGIALWLAGIAALLVYSGVSLIKLKKRLKTAVNNDGNVYISDCLTTPFVIGVFRPRIYLPANLSEEETRYILLHERTHIRRLDHIVKIVSYLVLCVHWFNPLVWIAFFLSGKDMEMSCDEAVIKKLGGGVKKDYSTSLLALATGKRIVGGSPLAFGEGNTKSRIKNVLSYKKPAFWVIIIALVGVAILTVGLITNPVSNRNAEVDLSDIEELNIGAEMPEILYCDEDTAIIKGTCGVVMYDFNKHTVSDRITFDTLGELGIYYPYTTSSPDGKTLYIAEDKGEILYTYKYNVRRKNFKEIKPIKPRDIESFKTGTLNERAEDYINMYYLSSWTMADLGDSFVYLRAKPNWAMNTLQLVVCDTLNGTNKVYNVWDGSEPESFTTEELQNHFPEKLFIIDKDNSSSCEYGICDYGALDENQMMAELDNMQGFTFTESEAEFKYVQFLFYDAHKPKENISMRYRADVDNIQNQEETVFPMSNDFRVPLKPGNYSYIADITWEDDTKETVYFRITIVSDGKDISQEEAKQKLLDVLNGSDSFDSENLTIEPQNMSVITVLGRNCYAFEEQWKDGVKPDDRSLNSYAVSLNGKKLYIRDATYGWWMPLSKISDTLTPIEFMYNLRENMTIEERADGLYAVMTVPAALPEGYYASNIYADFIAYSNNNYSEKTDLFGNHTALSEPSYRLEAGKTYTQKIDIELDENYRITRDVSITPKGHFMPICQLTDSYNYGSDSNDMIKTLEEIYKSISFNGGKASITIPKRLPEGVSADKISKFLRITFPYNGLDYVEQVLFQNTKFEAGKTYTENLDGKLYSGTSATIDLAIGNGNTTAKILMDYYPEAEFKVKEESGVTAEQAKEKLSAILKKNLPVNAPAWELRSRGGCIVDGNCAFSFNLYRVGGALLDTYAITDDFKKLYRAEYDVIPVRWQELKFDMSATVGNISPEAFLEQLRDSMVIEETNGALYAKMTVPEVIPNGYEVAEAGMFAYDISDRFNTTKLFGKHPQLSNDKYRLEAGKTYTQKIDIRLNGDTVISRWVELKNIKAPHISYELRDSRIYNTSNDEEQRFLEELYNSISVKNGEAKLTFPKELPAGFAANNLGISVHVSYPGTDSYGETQYLFRDAKFKSGKTITEKLTDKIYNGSLLSVDLTLRADRFNSTDADIAEIRVYRPLTPEATFDKEAKLIEEASGKLSDILRTVSDGSDRELKNGKKTTINGAPAYSFDMVYKDNVPVMGGRLIGYYAISEDYVSVYEMDRTTEKWSLKYDLMKPIAELESLVGQIYDSMTLENGTAKIVVPKNFPRGFSGKNLSVDFSVTYGYDSNEGWVIDNLFWNQEFEPGKTYTQKLKHEIADGTEVYRNVSIIAEGKTVSRKYDTIKYPLRRDDYTPKADILKNGVEFTDKYGDTFKVTLDLPKGWELSPGYSHQAVTVYKDGKAIGELFYSEFKLYPGTTEENYYRSVYSGLMLGSVITWDNEYKVISKTENGSIDICKPMQRETEGGLNPVTTYSKGILSHDRNLLKYMAMSFDENTLTDEEWLALAKSVKLSGTKNNQ